MKKTKIILSILLLGTLLAGCKEDTHYKLDAQASITKQIEMKNYVFTGNADIDLGKLISPSKDGNAITANLIGILQNSSIDFNGVANTEPVQLEVDLKAKPVVLAGTSLDLPIILKDNKLYMNIPLLSQKDEFFEIDLTKLGSTDHPNSALTPDSLKNISQISSSLSKLIVDDMQEAWFKKSKDVLTLQDGSKATLLTIVVDDKNKAALSAIFQEKLPKIISTLQTSGILSTEQAEKINQNNFPSIQIEIPSSIALTIDEAGFIREQQIKLTFSIKDAAGATATHHLNLKQTYDQINKNPAFTKEVSAKIKPFEDILKLLAPKK
ncbi:MAG: hypothetical protein WD469_14265 [Paenibacillaceae bacterium]